MLFVPYLLIAIAAAYIIYLLLNTPSQKPVQPDAQQVAREAMTASGNLFNTIEAELLAIIQPQFGMEAVGDIQKGFISKGMPVELLMMSWGKPGKKETLLPDGLDEKWYYEPDANNKELYHTEVIINNNKIVDWKDI